MKVAFRLNGLGYGGVEVATFDYAYYNQELLGNESIILYRENGTEPEIKKKFSEHFQTFPYKQLSDVKIIIEREKANVFYTLKSGENDGFTIPGVRNCNHAVFMTNQPHGQRYAYISKWLSGIMNHGLTPYVPHMINLPEESGNMRKELGIPKDAIVFGRYGSAKEFNIPFVHIAILEILKERNDIYFIFANTENFGDHDRIIYLDPIRELNEKVKFINTSDAMLHGRLRGETFGIACGEFSIKNKPVITYGLSPENAHWDILDKKALVYFNKPSLIEIIKRFPLSNDKNWDAYSLEYSPKPVMKKFKQIFL